MRKKLLRVLAVGLAVIVAAVALPGIGERRPW